MSEDDFSDPYDEPIMEISIETLTGTSFDMRVYPTDTVLDIKNKIQRVEGIPAHHQNLLFQLKELQDFNRMCDIGIVNGSKLKLVLAMRGGPISTRRLSTCDHHIVWKDLKDLIEHTRDEVGDKGGSKVSVLVFKEGEVINLIRVIENEDGSYSPYTDKAISPPYRTSTERDESQISFFKKITEDMEMASKMHSLKSKMQNLTVKRQLRNTKQPHQQFSSSTSSEKGDRSKVSGSDVKRKLNFLHNTQFSSSSQASSMSSLRSSRLAYRLLNDHMKNSNPSDYNQHLKRFESKITVQENYPQNDEIGEIALKDKHRSKIKVANLVKAAASSTTALKKTPPSEPVKSDTFPVVDHFNPSTSDNKSFSCRNLHVFEPERHISSRIPNNDEDTGIANPILSPLYNRYSPETGLKNRRSLHYDNKLNLEELSTSKMSETIEIWEDSSESDDKDILSTVEVPCAETLSLSARNRVHMTQLVLQDSSDRNKSSSESLELDDASQELWEIQHEPIKKSATYKLGLLKRRTSVDHTYDSDYNIESTASSVDKDNYNLNQEDYKYKGNDYEVFGRNFYHLPQYVSAPSAIPPQYAPKDERLCDLYLGSPLADSKMHRSPLYGRRARINSRDNFAGSDFTYGNETNFDLDITGGARRRTNQRSSVNSSSIERLRNEYSDAATNNTPTSKYYDNLDEIFGFYNAKSINDLDKFLNFHQTKSSGKAETSKNEEVILSEEIKRLGIFEDSKIQIDSAKIENLPALNKKRMRCEHCNKRLNITNIYNCRCGRIFCSQHRYSEVHDCKYDYKTEGRKILEQQNPLVTANKLPKF